MLGSHRWTEPVTAQHDSGSRWRGVIMGADVFSGLINISIAAALVTLLLRHVWIVPNLNALLAFAALIILTTTVLSFLSAQVAGRSTAGLRIGSSVNDNLTPQPICVSRRRSAQRPHQYFDADRAAIHAAGL